MIDYLFMFGARQCRPNTNVPKAEHLLGDRPGVGKLFNTTGHTNCTKLQARCNLQYMTLGPNCNHAMVHRIIESEFLKRFGHTDAIA